MYEQNRLQELVGLLVFEVEVNAEEEIENNCPYTRTVQKGRVNTRIIKTKGAFIG